MIEIYCTDIQQEMIHLISILLDPLDSPSHLGLGLGLVYNVRHLYLCLFIYFLFLIFIEDGKATN